MREIKSHSNKVGLCADTHGRIDLLEKLIDLHPAYEWFHIGDLVSFDQRAKNNSTVEKWYETHSSLLHWIKGNHDHTVAQNYIGVTHDFAWKIARWSDGIRVILPSRKNILLYHSKPKDRISFVDKGKYTEREFIDEYTDVDDDTLAVAIGHNHSQFKTVFPNVDAEIWSIGPLCEGKYALYDGQFQFRSL